MYNVPTHISYIQSRDIVDSSEKSGSSEDLVVQLRAQDELLPPHCLREVAVTCSIVRVKPWISATEVPSDIAT